ncbi:ABC transporter permease [Cellulomonas sp. URHB0016]
MTRVGALARAEGTLLRRDPLALLVAVGVPVMLVPMLASSGTYENRPGGLLVAVVGLSLLSGVYYNLVTAIVARREGHVLARLRTGELRDAEILLGTALPATALTWTQSLVACALALGLTGTTASSNVPTAVLPAVVLAVLAVVLGTAVFGLLAVVSSAFTRTVELAQVTSLPGTLVPLLLSGLVIPVDTFPDWVQTIAPFGPLTPVVDLLDVAFTGSDGPVLAPVGILLGWVGVGGWAARRWFRWEVRR